MCVRVRLSVCLSLSLCMSVWFVHVVHACVRVYILVFGLRDRIRFEIPPICAGQ